jgi:chromosome segregation ATPase
MSHSHLTSKEKFMQHNDSLVSQDFIRRHIGIPLEGLIPYALGASLLFASVVFADTEARPVLIVPKSAGDRNMQADAQPESFESYQIRILRNQNHLQAEKIKTLREELAEINQKLHEMKPRLFTQSDPADQAKIATLAEKLREKEELANQLTAAKNALERDFASVRKKLTEMETVKEALTAMIEKQRLTKDQSHSEFKKQIEELHASTASEKSSLLKTM